MNYAGQQRALGQKLIHLTYSCKYDICDYAELKVTINKMVQDNAFLYMETKK